MIHHAVDIYWSHWKDVWPEEAFEFLEHKRPCVKISSLCQICRSQDCSHMMWWADDVRSWGDSMEDIKVFVESEVIGGAMKWTMGEKQAWPPKARAPSAILLFSLRTLSPRNSLEQSRAWWKPDVGLKNKNFAGAIESGCKGSRGLQMYATTRKKFAIFSLWVEFQYEPTMRNKLQWST